MRTPLQSDGKLIALDVAASTHIYTGTIVCRDGDGNAVPGADAAGLLAAGVAEHEADNSNGAAGDTKIAAHRRVSQMNNSVTDPVTKANLLEIVFVEDDHTVNKTGGTNHVRAGLLVGVSDDRTKVLVDFGAAPFEAAAVAGEPASSEAPSSVPGYSSSEPLSS